MADTILFVLVGSQKDTLRSSGLLKAPREEYLAAVRKLQEISMYYREVEVDEARIDEYDFVEGCVLETAKDSHLARQLLQEGPADAVGQGDDETGGGTEQQGVVDGVAKQLTEDSGHLMSTIVGLNDTEDDGMQWLHLKQEIEKICPRRVQQAETPQRLISPVEQVVRNRAANVLDPANGGGHGLLLRSSAAGSVFMRCLHI